MPLFHHKWSSSVVEVSRVCAAFMVSKVGGLAEVAIAV